MKFNTDSYIEIGKSHNVCEDYALNGIIAKENPYIIVSDGCSSSKETDFGSRILAHSCRLSLFEVYHHGMTDKLNPFELTEYIKARTIHHAMVCIDSFNLPYSVCDATLLYAFIYKGTMIINGYGDGNIVLGYKGGKHTWNCLKYESGAPYYLSYEMDKLRKREYMDNPNFGGKKFYFEQKGTTQENTATCEFPVNENYSVLGSYDEVQFISLSSDGVETYYPANTEEKINEMIAYKNNQGEFVKRRMKKLKRECDKDGVEHMDDVSCATIWIDNA